MLVGHSLGGVLARAYAGAHPARVAGLVLVDSMGVHGRARQLAIWPRRDAPGQRRGLATTVLDGVDVAAVEALADRTTTLGAVPLAVVAAGREDAFPMSPASLGRALRRPWSRMERELAALSTNSVHGVALRADHDVQPRQTGDPAVVVAAARAVLHAARAGTGRPACERVFAGTDVRCGA